jgi:FtsP/CotA-like multicopper oxidase with cupredoxin domain
MTLNITNNLVPIAKEGEETEDANEITTVHWHGFKIPGPQDGGPDFPVNAGSSKQYNFTMLQPAAPLWFHPHPYHKTGNQVYQGLAGVFLLSDDITKKLEDDKQLPSGKYDIPVLVQDRRFAEEKDGVRKLVYLGGPTDHNGMLAHTQLVNGAQLPKLEVETRQYRLRLYSVGNARTYIFSLSNNAPFTIVGTDGGLLNKPVEVTSVTLSAAERAEIIIDFSKYAVGEKVMLISKPFNGSPLMPLLTPRLRHGGFPEGAINALPVDGSYADIMRFDITTQVTDDISLYTALPDYADINKERLTAKDATKTRKFVMAMTNDLHFTINGKVVELGRIDEYVKLSEGDTEIWSIQNQSSSAHPFHAHAIQWQVLSRNGEPATGMELGWKDTVYLRPGETVDLIGRFDPVVNYGDYMYHCHMLEHEDAGMMGMFNIQQ